MFNRFNSIILILLFALNAYSQCDGCPSSIEAPPSVGETPAQFNGFTSEVNLYDGDNPDCYMPISNSLNGQLEGIDNKICELDELIETLRTSCSDSTSIANIEATLVELQSELDSLKTFLVLSLDSTILVSTTTSSDSVTFNLSVNYDRIQDSLLVGVNAECLDSVESISQVLNDLIELSCDTASVVFSGGCVDFEAFYTMNVTSLPSSVQVEITPTNNLTSSPRECITEIKYTYEVLDVNNEIVEGGNGIAYGTTTLDVAYTFSIPTSYGNGARGIRVEMDISRQICSKGEECSVQSYENPLITAITAP